MLFSKFIYSGLPALLSRELHWPVRATAPPTASSDPCVKVAGLSFADPTDTIACQKSFPFNETLKQNVLSVVSGVFDFYTFEDFYLKSPPPFQDSTTDIRAELARINRTNYATDYDFNIDLFNFTAQLNDGHTRFVPHCYTTYQYILPAPVAIIDNGIFIAPDSAEFLNQLEPDFIEFFAAKNFNWTRLAGARVITIEGVLAADYIDEIARTVSGGWLDHNARVNSAVTSYRIYHGSFTQRLGDLAARLVLTKTSLTFSLIPVNSTISEFVEVPFVANFLGTNFTDGLSYWANNCAANNQTNGVDLRLGSGHSQGPSREHLAVFRDHAAEMGISLPDPYVPTLPPTNGSAGVIKSYILPSNKTGVMFVGSFDADPNQFVVDVDAAIKQLQGSEVTNLLIDVTDNPGGYVVLGYVLYQYLTGNNSGFPGFQSTSRANPLAQKIVKAGIEQGHNSTISLYAPDNWQFLNGTEMPVNFDYNDPSVPYPINGRNEPTSQRFEDVWPNSNLSVTFPDKPPFDLKNVVIVGNGLCASTCALFTTGLFERHQTRIAVFGGNLSRPIEYKGMAGNQVVQWTDLDTEIKTAGLKDDPLSPPDLLVSANISVNWRTAYSYFDESVPIAYLSEPAQYRFPYTIETYNNPQKLWLFAESYFFE